MVTFARQLRQIPLAREVNRALAFLKVAALLPLLEHIDVFGMRCPDALLGGGDSDGHSDPQNLETLDAPAPHRVFVENEVTGCVVGVVKAAGFIRFAVLVVSLLLKAFHE